MIRKFYFLITFGDMENWMLTESLNNSPHYSMYILFL